MTKAAARLLLQKFSAHGYRWQLDDKVVVNMEEITRKKFDRSLLQHRSPGQWECQESGNRALRKQIGAHIETSGGRISDSVGEWIIRKWGGINHRVESCHDLARKAPDKLFSLK